MISIVTIEAALVVLAQTRSAQGKQASADGGRASALMSLQGLASDILSLLIAFVSFAIVRQLMLPVLAPDSDKESPPKEVPEATGRIAARAITRRKPGKDFFGCTALHIAAHMGNADEVVQLLEDGFDPNSKEACGETPLHLAARAGDLEVATELLKSGADPAMCNSLHKSPFGIADQREDKAMCELLQPTA